MSILLTIVLENMVLDGATWIFGPGAQTATRRYLDGVQDEAMLEGMLADLVGIAELCEQSGSPESGLILGDLIREMLERRNATQKVDTAAPRRRLEGLLAQRKERVPVSTGGSVNVFSTLMAAKMGR